MNALRGIEDVWPDEDPDLDGRCEALVTDPSDLGVAWSPAVEHGLPSPVVVGSRTFDVRVFDAGLDEEWGGLLGRISDAIYIRRDTPDHWRETLLHEILHAVDYAAGTEAGEEVVNAWAPVLLDVLRRHPDVVSFLAEHTNGPTG